MPKEMTNTSEPPVARETRIERLEERVAEMRAHLEKLSMLLRGNGEAGLLGQVFLNSERLATLQGQWKWVVGILAALAVTVVQAFLMR